MSASSTSRCHLHRGKATVRTVAAVSMIFVISKVASTGKRWSKYLKTAHGMGWTMARHGQLLKVAVDWKHRVVCIWGITVIKMVDCDLFGILNVQIRKAWEIPSLSKLHNKTCTVSHVLAQGLLGYPGHTTIVIWCSSSAQALHLQASWSMTNLASGSTRVRLQNCGAVLCPILFLFHA